MRLLNMTDPGLVQIILEELYTTITNFANWSVSKENGVRVLSGEDEAIFGWISANLMAGGVFNNGQSSKSLGSLHMDDASAQKVNSCHHILKAEQQPEITSCENVQSLSLFGAVYNVTSSSALCYGLEEAMKRFAASLIYESYKKSNKTLQKSIMNPCLSQNFRYKLHTVLQCPVDLVYAAASAAVTIVFSTIFA